MNKIFFALTLSFILVSPILAQEPGIDLAGLPTAAEGVQQIAIFLASLTGLLASRITDGIKALPIFTTEEKSRLSGAYAELVSVIASILAGYAIGYAAVLAGFMDQSGIWQLILFTWPAAKGWFEASSLRRAMDGKK